MSELVDEVWVFSGAEDSMEVSTIALDGERRMVGDRKGSSRRQVSKIVNKHQMRLT